MVINSNSVKGIHRRILIDLYSSPNGLYAFTLYGRYGLTPSKAISFMEEFNKEGYIQIDNDNRITLTKTGREHFLALVKNTIPTQKHTNSYLDQFRSEESIAINVPYLPNESFYFKQLERETAESSQ